MGGVKLGEEGGKALLIYTILGVKERLGSFQIGTKTVLLHTKLPNRDIGSESSLQTLASSRPR